MLSSSLLVLPFLSLIAPVSAAPFLESSHDSLRREVHTPSAIRSPSPDVISTHVLSLTRMPGGTHTSALFRWPWSTPKVHGVYGVGKLIPELAGQEFVTSIKFGSESFEVVVDTGSSDTWLSQSKFQCLDLSDMPQPESECAFGPLYTPSSTFQRIPNLNFNITYADAEFLNGYMGYEQVTLAGITVKNQEVGIVNVAAWDGDGVSSGLVGLAFPLLTSAYKGNNPDADVFPDTQVVYNPIFTNMYKEGNVAPVFSLALSRTTASTGDYIALGGLPPVAYNPPFVSTPIRIYTIGSESCPQCPAGKPQFQFYAIDIDGFKYTGSAKQGSAGAVQVIVDSGTTLNYVPQAISDAVNALFVPPAVYNDDYGIYITTCNAKAPAFGVTIAGTTFYTNPADMLIDGGLGDNQCLTGISVGSPGNYILGDVFLTNVLAVFDVGASEMRFAAREFYR